MVVSLFIYIITYFSASATHEFSRSVVIIARTGDGRRSPPPCGTIPSLAAVLVPVTRALASSNFIVHLLTDTATTCRQSENTSHVTLSIRLYV